MTLNPQTGTMTVTPNVLQVAVVTYQVKEYRNGVLVGVVTRDVQFVIRACTGNASPTATGINGTAVYSMQVCAGTPVSFTVNSNDAECRADCYHELEQWYPGRHVHHFRFAISFPGRSRGPRRSRTSATTHLHGTRAGQRMSGDRLK